MVGGVVNTIVSEAVHLIERTLMSPEYFFILPDPLLLVADFVAGAMSLGLLSRFIVPNLILTTGRGVGWSTWGMRWGALACFLSSFIFATIHISMESFGIEGWHRVMSSLAYLLVVNPVISGVPAALIGALAGGICEFFWRRFSKT